MSDENTAFFLLAQPITHKKKVFAYGNFPEGVQAGDYVYVQFRDRPLIALVTELRRGSPSRPPENFMGQKRVLRKLTYEEDAFIRFLTDLRSLPAGALYRDAVLPDGRTAYSEDELQTACARVNRGETPTLREKLLLLEVKERRKGEAGERLLRPRLTETTLAAFEAVYRVRLPEAYRIFVTTVSNGFGPIRGLDAERYHGEYACLSWPFVFEDSPFPLTPEGIPEADCEEDECTDCARRLSCPDSDAFDLYRGVERRLFAGLLTLYDEGGDDTLHMVVGGTHAGEVLCYDGYFGRAEPCSPDFQTFLRQEVDKRFFS